MKKKIILTAVSLMLLTSCTQVQPPHVVVACKIKFDACMVKNTFEGPIRSHNMCMSQRTSECR